MRMFYVILLSVVLVFADSPSIYGMMLINRIGTGRY